MLGARAGAVIGVVADLCVRLCMSPRGCTIGPPNHCAEPCGHEPRRASRGPCHIGVAAGPAAVRCCCLHLRHQWRGNPPGWRHDLARGASLGAEPAGGSHRRQAVRDICAPLNGNIANKLLVMVDGRTIYSPLFSGTFWDAQDFVPSDIDRIEVISGPAGATWGTNAVNGVINVVTLSAAKTQGAALSTTFGNLEKTVVGRYGFAVSDDIAVRAHVPSSQRDASQLRGGGDLAMRPKAPRRGSELTGPRQRRHDARGRRVHGQYGRPTGFGPVDLHGSNVTGRWSRKLDDTSNFDVQVSTARSARTTSCFRRTHRSTTLRPSTGRRR